MNLSRLVHNKPFDEVKILLESEPYFLRVKESPAYPTLYIVSYKLGDSPLSNLVVQECRGIILEKNTNKIVCYPFNKFFNFNEENAPELDPKTTKVYEKLDGSFMKLFWYNEEWILTTNNAIDARSNIPHKLENGSKSFYDLFHESFDKFPYEKLVKKYTYMFEMCHPHTSIVVQHSKPSVYLIGVRDMETFDEVEIERFPFFKLPQSFNLSTLEECSKTLAKDFTNPYEFEGFVLVDHMFRKVKMKTKEYVEIHHTASNADPALLVLAAVLQNEQDEIFAYNPWLRSGFAEYKEKHEKYVNHVVDQFMQCIPENMFRKQFALKAKESSIRLAILMTIFNKVKNRVEPDFIKKMTMEVLADEYKGKKLKVYYEMLNKD